MENYRHRLQIPYAPTEEAELYPDSDGKPMAVSDLHRRILTRTLAALDAHFKDMPEVYVSGDILMYYVEGDPRKSISPDALVAFGLGKKPRRTYLVWKEGKAPDFAMEFSSKSTYRNDLSRKMELYALLGIQDYFLYDVEGLYLPSSLMGFTLIDGWYVAISPGTDGSVHSTALGLDFHVDAIGVGIYDPDASEYFEGDDNFATGNEVGLGIYDPVAGKWLQTPAESATERAEQAETRAQQAETHAEQQTARAQQAETHAEQQTARAQQAETHAEQQAARAQQAETHAEQQAARAQQAETHAEQQVVARQKAELEIARLQEEIARLQARS